jgi:hypothetical protein
MSDSSSYKKVLKDNGLTEKEVQEQVNRDDVMTGIPNVYTAKSKIHGIGCFTSRAVRKGNIICPARIRDKRTIAGRYSNHAENHNAYSVALSDSFILVARRDIKKDEEITLNYQQVRDVNVSVS